MQEHVLSPRLLVYASHTMQWRCRTTTRNFGDYIHNPGHAPMRLITPSGDIFPRPTPDAVQSCAQFSPSYLKDGFLDNTTTASPEILKWTEPVMHCTAGQSSASTDKLTALSGIAAAFLRLPGSQYLAGLWSKSLLQQLSWKRDYTWKRGSSVLKN